jgi:hypothetical protein
MTRQHIESFGEIKDQRADGTANTLLTMTITIPADEVGVLRWVGYSYNAAPGSGKLSVTIGSLKYEVDVVSSDAVTDFIHFEDGLVGDGLGDDIVIALAAGGAGVTGKVNAGYS